MTTTTSVNTGDSIDLEATADSLGWPAPSVKLCDRCGDRLTEQEAPVVDICGECCPRDGIEADPIPGDPSYWTEDLDEGPAFYLGCGEW